LGRKNATGENREKEKRNSGFHRAAGGKRGKTFRKGKVGESRG